MEYLGTVDVKVPPDVLEQFINAYFVVIRTLNQAKLHDKQEELHMLEKLSGKTNLEPKEKAYIDKLKAAAEAQKSSAESSYNELQEFFNHSEYGKVRVKILLIL